MKRIEQEEFLEILEELRGNILIVEGKKDEKALRSLGMRHILKVNSRPIGKVVQDAASMAEKHKNRQVIVLTDFDRTGRRLASQIRLLLQSRNIHADYRIRRDVMNLGIKCTEELASLSRSLEKGEIRRGSSKMRKKECDDYGEISADVNEIRGKGLHKGKRDNREA
jgi:5S rRNA maturation endonuclease (ribonuclease M5)